VVLVLAACFAAVCVLVFGCGFEEMDLEKLVFNNYINALSGYAIMEIVAAVSTTALEK